MKSITFEIRDVLFMAGSPGFARFFNVMMPVTLLGSWTGMRDGSWSGTELGWERHDLRFMLCGLGCVIGVDVDVLGR